MNYYDAGGGGSGRAVVHPLPLLLPLWFLSLSKTPPTRRLRGFFFVARFFLEAGRQAEAKRHPLFLFLRLPSEGIV